MLAIHLFVILWSFLVGMGLMVIVLLLPIALGAN